MSASLTDFEGLPVRQSAIEIPGAAGGLREAMKVEPAEFHKGEHVYVVLECEVAKVRFDPISKDDLTGDQRRVHVFNVEGATIVDESLVRQHLDEQADKIKRAREEAQGIQRLPEGDAGWGDEPGPLDPPVDAEAGKVIEGAFGPGDGPADGDSAAETDGEWEASAGREPTTP